MPQNAQPGSRFLSAEHANSTETAHEWDQDNQQWWNWYMSLAENEPDLSQQPLVELPEPTPDENWIDVTWSINWPNLSTSRVSTSSHFSVMVTSNSRTC